MKNQTTADYGSWKSPITSDLVSSASIRFDGQVETDEGDLYWAEMLPSDAGRFVIARRTGPGQTEDVTSRPFNVGTTVYGLGRGAYAVDRGTVYFSNLADRGSTARLLGLRPKLSLQSLGNVSQTELSTV